jgi:hypothetical protein
MENRLPPEGIIRPTTAIPWTSTRPLSDIKEITEPNLTNKAAILKAPTSRSRRVSQKSNADGSSDYEVPPFHLPRRRSSMQQQQPDARPSTETDPFSAPVLDMDRTVPSRQKSRLPVRHLVAKKSIISSDIQRKIPSRTVLRTKLPMMVVENPNIRHPRIKVDLHTTSPSFVGGGTVEGKVMVEIGRVGASRRKAVFDISLLERLVLTLCLGRKPSWYSVVYLLMLWESKKFIR